MWIRMHWYRWMLLCTSAQSCLSYPFSLFLKACRVKFMVLNGHHGVFLSKLNIKGRAAVWVLKYPFYLIFNESFIHSSINFFIHSFYFSFIYETFTSPACCLLIFQREKSMTYHNSLVFILKPWSSLPPPLRFWPNLENNIFCIGG